MSESYFFVFLRIRRQPRSPLFPYTTLFRSTVRPGRRDFPCVPVRPAAPRRTPGQGESAPRSATASHTTPAGERDRSRDRKSTRLNSSHANISYAVFCLKKKKHTYHHM